MESGLFAAAPKITANLQYFSRAAYGEKPILQKCRNFALDPQKKGKLGENDALLQELCRRSAIGSKITAPVQDFFFEGAPAPLAPPPAPCSQTRKPLLRPELAGGHRAPPALGTSSGPSIGCGITAGLPLPASLAGPH